jgi:AraC-like DNA-binding protein
VGELRSTAQGYTVSADLVNGVIDCAVRCGLPRDRFSDLVSGDAGTRFSIEHILKLWDRINRVSDDAIIGFRMAHEASAKTFGVLGQVLPRCATLLEAYRQTARYSALAAQGVRIAVTASADTLDVALELPHLKQGDVSRTITLWGLTNLCLTPQRLGVEAQPRQVSCAHPSPGPSALRALTERLPFKCDARENRITFDRRVGDLSVPSADAELQSLLVETMDRRLSALDSDLSFAASTVTVLRGMLNGNMPTLASLAARTGMSQRTLQRRLSEANTTFQSLLNQVLREQADDLLARGTLSQGEIAFLLGYSEVSAFSRAYHSWTGRPPGAALA